MFFFSSQVYLRAIFYIAWGFLKKLKTLVLPLLLLKWNKTCCIDFFFDKIFVSFVKLLNINLDE